MRIGILGSGAVARKSNLRFAEHVRDGRSQLVCEIGGELREPCEGIVKSLEHFVEGDRQWLEFAGPSCGTNMLF